MSYKNILMYFLTSEHFAAYTQVAGLCRKNPCISVKYILRTFSPHPCYHIGSAPRGFIHQGIVLLENADELLEYAKALRGRLQMRRWTAPNLKFFAADFDEGIFRELSARINFDDIEGGLDKWIEAARDWAKNGF